MSDDELQIELNNWRNSGVAPAKLLPSGRQKTPASVIAYTNTLGGRLKCLLKGARSSSKTKNREVSLTEEDLLDMWTSQGGRCAYTGWDMSTETNSPRLVSIERKDSAHGYTKENCILVSWCTNRAKNMMTKRQFVDMCAAVYKHHLR